MRTPGSTRGGPVPAGPPRRTRSEDEEAAEEYAIVGSDRSRDLVLHGAGELEPEPHARPRVDDQVGVPPHLVVPVRAAEGPHVAGVHVAVVSGQDHLSVRELGADEQGAEVERLEMAVRTGGESGDSVVDVAEGGEVRGRHAGGLPRIHAAVQTGEQIAHSAAGGRLAEERNGERAAL